MPITQTTVITCNQCGETLPVMEDGIPQPFIGLSLDFPRMTQPVTLSNLTCLTNWTAAQVTDNANPS